MGISIGVSNSSYDRVEYVTKTKIVKVPKPLPNPNPNNYKIIRQEQVGDYLVVKIKYLDCTNYEGDKIMVYKCHIEDLINQGSIDPHFSENKNYHSPIARFEPTKKGWDMAMLLVTIQNGQYAS
jgi:hypothetical protein